ncbi:hypothetical protein F5876DRAFT_66682 [Lentinula aff. lateritia]|uniref:Uncharacterized protein n=1 Tax=Lentinula aff. lateritia TaxID=2804960 RepID=A0ACC1TWP6_9AGAR|nr:hypothetical protein F5876DRAFT_66682 [Lentinula aff. lateritia]
METTLRGEGMDYREFEPSEGFMHQGLGRERRIRAGLRYSKGGKRKYWLPTFGAAEPPGRIERGVDRVVQKVAGRDQAEDVYAPLLVDLWSSSRIGVEEGFDLPFGDLNDDDEALFAHCKRYLFGDYNYPCINASTEFARAAIWDEEERILRDEHGVWFSPIRESQGLVNIQQKHVPGGYGAMGTLNRQYVEDVWEERVIDMELEREERKVTGAVKMQWARNKNQSRPSGSGSRSPQTGNSSRPTSHSPNFRVRVESAGSSSTPGASTPSQTPAGSPGASRLSSLPNPLSRNNSSNNKSRTPPLPPDAIDLVKRLRRVYRRGFVARDGRPEERREIEVEGHGQGRVEAGEEIVEAIEHEGDHVESAVERVEGDDVDLEAQIDHETTTGVAEQDSHSQNVVIARSTTRPAYARPRYDLDDDNPWIQGTHY